MPVPETSVMAAAVSPVKALQWAELPNMCERRVYCSSALHRGSLYVIGGCGEGGAALTSVEVLDLETQRWSNICPLPTARAGAGCVVLPGGQVMVLGGMDRHQTPLSSVDVYHPDEGRWASKASLGQAAMGVTAVEREGKVYVFGGMGVDTSPLPHCFLFEPNKDQWACLPSMPTPRYGASAFTRGNKIYLMGGRQGKMPVTALESFDLEVRGWTRLPCVPSRRAFSGCVSSDTSLFSLGGLQQPGPHNFYSRPHFVSTVEEYDLQHGSWLKSSRTSRMREKRADFVAGFLGGRVIAIGGLGNQPSPLSSVESYNPQKRRWEGLTPLHTPRCSPALVQTDSALFVIGGVSQGPSSAVEALCLQEAL